MTRSGSKKIAKLRLGACRNGGWSISVYNTKQLEYVQFFDPKISASAVVQNAVERRELSKRFKLEIDPPDMMVESEVKGVLSATTE
ncbi:MAG: hypothetical protein F4Z01_04420 [Gammaproteobacteria bacterium]|nr:hypothetical protein [Gammaproteobacteria bacterium]MYF37436.1 hypothetical protein [Gammaproteobacteria bacterium]